jgi:sodium/proline symporter
MTEISFLFFLLVFLVIGLYSAKYRENSRHDYYLADRKVPPWLVGLSAMATNNSGYMFIGIIGYTYATGLASLWLMFGWIAGDFLSSLFVHKQLRTATERTDAISFIGALGKWHGGEQPVFQRLGAVISLMFLMAYAAAQMVAGGKALEVLLGWPQWGGAVASAVLVVTYCYAGGIRASIWTDAAQSTVMITAMALLLFMAVSALGGVDHSLSDMEAIKGFMDWTPSDLPLPGMAGGLLFILGWMFAGLSVIGQPHIMIRFMTLKDSSQMTRARIWYYTWYTAFYALAAGVGLLSRIYLSDSGSFDAELALPMMASKLMPPVLVGLVLAGIFAATMSTADSLLLSCSAAITHDLLPRRVERTRVMKLATIGVTALALGWALLNSSSVFNLVIMSWSAMASAFAPILILLALGRRLSQNTAIGIMLTGLAVSLTWRWAGLQGFVYEGMPGILSGLLLYTALSTRTVRQLVTK